MQISCNMRQENNSSSNLSATYLSYDLSHDVDDVRDYVERRSKYYGYAFFTDKATAEDFKISKRQWQRKLKKAKDEGVVESRLISRGRHGKQRVLYLKERSKQINEILEACPPNKVIGKNKIKPYYNPEINKILARTPIVSDPIFYPKSDQKNQPDVVSNVMSDVVCNRGYKNTKSTKEEVVYKSDRPPQNAPPFFKERGYKRQATKKEHQLLAQERDALVKSYGEEIVSEKERNYRSIIDKIESHNNMHGKFYNKSMYETVKAWCQEKLDASVRQKEKAKRIEAMAVEKTESEIIETRRKMLRGNPLIAKYCVYNKDDQAVCLSPGKSSPSVQKYVTIRGVPLGLSCGPCSTNTDEDFRRRLDVFLDQLSQAERHSQYAEG